jgi:hypothetical protein
MKHPANHALRRPYKYTLTVLTVFGAVTGLGASNAVGRAVPALTMFNSESALLVLLASIFFLAGRFLRTSSLVSEVDGGGGQIHQETVSLRARPLSDAEPSH